MRHSVFGRKLSRTKNERRRLLQGLVRDLLFHGTIRTTLAKAKAVQPLVEKLITKAKDGSRASLKQVEKVIGDKEIIMMLTEDAKTRFSQRTSGHTRIVRLGKRLGDATEEVLFSLVDERVVAEVMKPKEIKAVKATEAVKDQKKAVKKSVKKTVAT